jgi:hypothetical protein
MSLLSIKLQKLEYNKIVKLAKATGEYDQFLKGVSLSCDNCGAFIVQAPALVTMLEHLINIIDSNHIPDSFADDQDNLYDALLETRDMMFKTVILTKDEWARLFTDGLSGYEFLCDGKGQPITDTEGNLQALVSKTVLVEFNKKCGCRKILNRLT